MELLLGIKVCKKTRFKVLDCKAEGTLSMPFLKFNPDIDWTTVTTTIDKYTILLVDHQAYTNYSRLEIVYAKAFVKGLKQGKYTLCGYVDSI